MLKQVRQIWDVGWSGQIPLHANDLNCEDFVKQYSMAVMEAFL